jgi:hypothetical protein
MSVIITMMLWELQGLFSARAGWVVADGTWEGAPLPGGEKVSIDSYLPGSATLCLKTDGPEPGTGPGR